MGEKRKALRRKERRKGKVLRREGKGERKEKH